jgi:hypothetical protein
MANDKNTPQPNDQTGSPENSQGNRSKINPFKDAAGENLPEEPTADEETELEQQRKEAMTERD